jgi:cystathionine beta-lyase/cystathionine gamma-synthase
MGGIILCKEDFLKDHLQIFLRNTGPCMSPFNAWVHLKSLETLDIRMREHSRNAVVVADFLAKERNVRRVLYPFREDGLNAASNHPQVALAKKQMSAGGGVVTFEVTGGKKEAFKVAKALKTCRHFQQSRRHQEPAHASRHNHASAHDARSAACGRRDRRHAADFGRAGRFCRHLRRSRAGAGANLKEARMEHHATIVWQRTSDHVHLRYL